MKKRTQDEKPIFKICPDFILGIIAMDLEDYDMAIMRFKLAFKSTEDQLVSEQLTKLHAKIERLQELDTNKTLDFFKQQFLK